MTALRLRRARPADVAAMAALVGCHVRAGGRTAIAEPPSPGTLAAAWLTGPTALLCRVAKDGGGLAGVQAVCRHPHLPPGWGDVASFVREGGARRGTGRRLFGDTRREAAALGLVALVAVIRPENAPARAFYGAMGVRAWRDLPDGRHALRQRIGP